MMKKDRIYREPEMEIVRVAGNADVITMSTGGTGQPGSGTYDEVFGGV